LQLRDGEASGPCARGCRASLGIPILCFYLPGVYFDMIIQLH
jgi:hypothetical protein